MSFLPDFLQSSIKVSLDQTMSEEELLGVSQEARTSYAETNEDSFVIHGCISATSLKNPKGDSIQSVSSKMCKVFSAVLSPFTGAIRMPLTPNSGKMTNLLYAIYDDETQAVYFGKTEQQFKKRIAQHAYLANHPDADDAKRPLYQLMRQKPDKIRFGIVKTLEDVEGIDPALLAILEQNLISEVSENLSLNSNGGGGGGSAKHSDDTTISSSEMPEIEEFTTPEKYTRLQSKDDTVQACFSPITASQTDVVYVIKDFTTGKRYIGITGQKMRSRMSHHMHFVNHPEKKRGQKSLYQDIRDNPTNFGIGLLAKNVHPTKIDKLERRYIFEKDAVGNGYNVNGGGGGSHPTKKRFKPL